MEDLQIRVLKTITRHIEEQPSFAYFELVCTEVFNEFNEANEKKLNEVLDILFKKNRITIDGDRIGIRESDFLVILGDEDDIQKITNLGLNCEGRYCNIGHGCDIPAIGVEILQDILTWVPTMVTVGLKLKELKDATEGYSYFKNIITEAFGSHEIDEREGERLIFSEKILKSIAIEKIIKAYENEKINEVRLVSETKFSISSATTYAVQNSGFSEKSLEGNPEYMGYFVFEVWIDNEEEFTRDYDLLRIEILSSGKIISFNKTPINVSLALSGF